MYIYRIYTAFNGKCYIGLDSKPPQKLARWKRHLWAHNKPQSYPSKLYNAMLKHGAENFMVEILEVCASREELVVKEAEYIKSYDSITNGYNILPAELCAGIPLSEANKSILHQKRSEGSKIGNKNRWDALSKDERSEFYNTHLTACPKIRAARTKAHWDAMSEKERAERIRNYTWKENDSRIEWQRDHRGFANHKLAIPYDFIDPSGVTYTEVYGIKMFCKDRELSPVTMKRVADGKILNYKGWVCRYHGSVRREPLIKNRGGCAKTYTFIDPNGDMKTITNLAGFCRENNLGATCMRLVYNGKQLEHRGWKRYEIE